MEHRIGERKKAILCVSVSQGGRFLGGFTTRDICPGGVSVYGEVVDLDDSSIVNVMFESGQPSADGKLSLKAFVVHQDDGCIGLMWIENMLK